MPITDYITPSMLHKEGWVHTSDPEMLLANIDKQYLAQAGYVNIAETRNVEISVHKAAQIAGVTSPTLASYIKAGYLALTPDGKVNLFDVLAFNYKLAKRAELNKKERRVLTIRRR